MERQIVIDVFKQVENYHQDAIIFCRANNSSICTPATVMIPNNIRVSMGFARYNANESAIPDFARITYRKQNIDNNSSFEEFTLFELKEILILLMLQITPRFVANTDQGPFEIHAPYEVINAAIAYLDSKIALIDNGDLTNNLDLIQQIRDLKEKNEQLENQLAIVQSAFSGKK